MKTRGDVLKQLYNYIYGGYLARFKGLKTVKHDKKIPLTLHVFKCSELI